MEYLIITLAILSAILWVWAVIDINRSRLRGNTSQGWLFLVFIFPMIGPLVYFQVKERN